MLRSCVVDEYVILSIAGMYGCREFVRVDSGYASVDSS